MQLKLNWSLTFAPDIVIVLISHKILLSKKILILRLKRASYVLFCTEPCTFDNNNYIFVFFLPIGIYHSTKKGTKLVNYSVKTVSKNSDRAATRCLCNVHAHAQRKRHTKRMSIYFHKIQLTSMVLNQGNRVTFFQFHIIFLFKRIYCCRLKHIKKCTFIYWDIFSHSLVILRCQLTKQQSYWRRCCCCIYWYLYFTIFISYANRMVWGYLMKEHFK